MKHTRIIEKKNKDGSKCYVIQQKHFIFWWIWTNASRNNIKRTFRVDSFTTLKYAQNNLHLFK